MSSSPPSALTKLLRFLDRLERAKLHYHLEHVRNSIMVVATIPGEIWEIEFFDDDHVEIERFRSTGDVEVDEALLDQLVTEYESS